jgi:GH25 family lysozyme M1 (1,4-beta-N-acetylmuramidase)
MHISKTLFRGAYHFFRPGVDPEKQADAFLAAIGAINGKRPKQLPPALDIEWATRSVEPGSFEFDACPRDRLSHDKAHNRWFCDMWYTVSSEEIADTAQKWIDRVEAATGLPVIIYTNPSWWNSVMQDAGLPLIARQAVWTSRYTSEGPVYKQSWTVQGGSPEWGMAPLPKGARYPRKSYSVAHSWQFTETGHLSDSIFTCSGNLTERAVDLNWLPTNRSDFEYLFKVKD